MQLCDNSQSIDEWKKTKQEEFNALDPDVQENLRQFLANCNFNRKIILTG